MSSKSKSENQIDFEMPTLQSPWPRKSYSLFRPKSASVWQLWKDDKIADNGKLASYGA